MSEETTLSLGQVIKKCRTELGMTQVELAEKIGTTDAYVSALETDRKLPSYSIIELFANIFDYDKEALYNKVKAQREQREIQKAKRRYSSYTVDSPTEQGQTYSPELAQAIKNLRLLMNDPEQHPIIIKLLETLAQNVKQKK